ncbi:MAG: hypothetical protein ACK559_20990, partial [bacterium]
MGGWGWRGGRQQLLEGGRHSEQLVGRESVVRGTGQWDFPDFHKPGGGYPALGLDLFFCMLALMSDFGCALRLQLWVCACVCFRVWK